MMRFGGLRQVSSMIMVWVQLEWVEFWVVGNARVICDRSLDSQLGTATNDSYSSWSTSTMTFIRLPGSLDRGTRSRQNPLPVSSCAIGFTFQATYLALPLLTPTLSNATSNLIQASNRRIISSERPAETKRGKLSDLGCHGTLTRTIQSSVPDCSASLVGELRRSFPIHIAIMGIGR